MVQSSPSPERVLSLSYRIYYILCQFIFILMNAAGTRTLFSSPLSPSVSVLCTCIYYMFYQLYMPDTYMRMCVFLSCGESFLCEWSCTTHTRRTRNMISCLQLIESDSHVCSLYVCLSDNAVKM